MKAAAIERFGAPAVLKLHQMRRLPNFDPGHAVERATMRVCASVARTFRKFN
jgi:hypothetical protein